MLPQPLALAFLLQLPPALTPEPRAAPAATPLVSYAAAPRAPVRITYEGSWSLEAHLSKPHAVRTFGTRLSLLDGGPERARLDWSTWKVGHEDVQELETTLLDGARVLHRAEAGKPFTVVEGRHADLLRARLEAVAPWRTLARVAAARERVAEVTGESFTWSERAGADGFTRAFAWNPTTGRLTSVTREFAHPRLGDTRDDVRYAAWTDVGGITVPAALVVHEFEGQDVLKSSPTTFELHFVKLEPAAEFAQELAVPPDVLPASAAAAATGRTPISVTELEPGLTAFASRALDAQTIVVEFADHLVAIGAPLSSALGEDIVDAIQARFPSQPIRYVLAGHYHPHYTGGLRAFLAAGASVVATEGIAQLAAEIAASPFTLAPDRWAAVSRTPVIETFRDRRVFADATRRLELIDIGARSEHTDEYVVFYFPSTRTLLQDDIGWGATKDGALRFGARSRGLYDSIVELKLDVAMLWQGWPVASPRPSITFAEFEAGVRAAR